MGSRETGQSQRGHLRLGITMDEPQKSIKNRSLELKWAREQVRILKQKQVDAFRQRWMTSKEVMMVLGISRRTLQKLRDKGALPFVRLFGKFFYKVKDVYVMLESRYNKPKKTRKNE